MAHEHSHAPKNFDRAFAIGVGLNVGFVVIEVVFGLFSNSLALLADAGHNLSDVLGLLLAWGASILVRRKPTQRHTYGLRRASVLAALINAIILLLAVGAIAWEAILRFGQPEAVESGTVILVASIGVLINGVTAWLFISGKKQDVNIRGAYLHMAADAAISLGVVVTAIAMYFTGWLWLDPVVSLAIAVVIGISTWGLLSESLNLALDAVPANIEPEKVEAYLASLPGIKEVHDLHIWAMSSTEVALTVHLVKPDAMIDDALLEQINNELREKFSIQHTTVQFELGDSSHPCQQAPVEVV
uniref:Cation diffusion facilitator (CDF) family transporter n=1 Tax=Hydrogenovibrio crunogenus (strain DSM 25203 / XCL-2) TaxID=317025 RepID=Q31GW4_HYDCU